MLKVNSLALLYDNTIIFPADKKNTPPFEVRFPSKKVEVLKKSHFC